MKDCQLFHHCVITKRGKISKSQYANEIIVTDSSRNSGIQGQRKYKKDLIYLGISIRGSVCPFVGLSIHLLDIE